MAYELDQSTNNSVLFDDVIVSYPKGFIEVGSEGVAAAIARHNTQTQVDQTVDSLLSLTEEVSVLQASINDPDTGLSSKASNTRVNEVESDAQNARATQTETLTSEFRAADQILSDDYNKKLSDAEKERESLKVEVDSKANITQLSEVETNAQSARTSLYENLTSDFQKADEEQQTEINTKASASRVDQVESDATSARTLLQSIIEADYTNAIDKTAARIDEDINSVEAALKNEIDSRATIDQLADAQSDNEMARVELGETLTSRFNEGIDSAKIEALEAAEDGTPRARIRYIRDWLNGSTINTGSHWVEIQAFAGDENRALGVSVTGTGGTSAASRVTDGNLDTNSYDSAGTGLHNRVVDLGVIHSDIDRLKVYHYFKDGRTYHDTKTEVSTDGENWITLFDSSIDGEYAETSDGHLIQNNLTTSLQTAIDSKATNDRVNEVESDAQSARATLKNTIETDYNEAIGNVVGDLQSDINTRATKTELAEFESNAEDARASLSESLSTEFEKEVTDAREQASKAQRTADNGRFNLEINENPGEFRIYGNSLGEPDPDSDFIVTWNGQIHTFARAQSSGGWTGLTGASRSKGFIGLDMEKSEVFNGRNVGFVRNNNGRWQYDDNRNWVDLNSIDSIAAIGWMEAGDDFIYAAGLFAFPVSVGLASYPSADVTGDNTARNTVNVGNRSADEINNEIDSKATIDQITELESNAEGARGLLEETLRAEYQNADAQQQTQIDSKASITRVDEVESNAESSSASLRQDVSAALGEEIAGVSTSYKARIDGLTDDVQAQFMLAVTGTRDDGTRIVGGAKLGTDGETVDLVLSLNNLAIQSPGDDGSLVYPFIYSNGQTVVQEALIQSLTFGKLVDSSGNFIVDENGRLKARYIDVDNLSVNYNLVVGGPPSDADRTADNTSLDTANVDGQSSRLVRQSSQLSLTNDFEGADGSSWNNSTQSDGSPSLIISSDYAYSGTRCGLFQSIQTNPYPYATGGIPRIRIPQSIADRFSGQRIRISVYALSKAFFSFGLSYSVDNYGYSGWQIFRPSQADTWEKFSFVYDVPETTQSAGTYLNVWGDTSGNNYNTYIDLLTINIVSKDGDIDATKTLNGPREAGADRTSDNESASTRSGKSTQNVDGQPSWEFNEDGSSGIRGGDSDGSVEILPTGIYIRDGNGNLRIELGRLD